MNNHVILKLVQDDTRWQIKLTYLEPYIAMTFKYFGTKNKILLPNLNIYDIIKIWKIKILQVK